MRIVGAKKALVTDIVRFNNTQNPVKLSAVRLLDPIQEAHRIALKKIGYDYAPKQEGARASKAPSRIELEKVAQYLASTHDDTILEAVSKKRELFDRSYKAIFPRTLRSEEVFLVWLLAQEVEEVRIQQLESLSGEADNVMRAILGVHGTPWGIYVAYQLIRHIGLDSTKLTLTKMKSDEFKNAVKKYARKAVDLYCDIAVNVLTDIPDTAQPRNELRVKAFLEKLKRTLGLRMARSSTWKLAKLHVVTVAK